MIRLAAVLVVAALPAVASAAPAADGPLAAAAAKPKCLGKTATIVGTKRSDKGRRKIKGTRKADVIVARGGADDIRGRGGNDLICADGGNDTVDGGAGNDVIDGGSGKDRLKGGSGDDVIGGGSGNDTLDGGRGTDVCDGGKGKNKLKGCEPLTGPGPGGAGGSGPTGPTGSTGPEGLTRAAPDSANTTEDASTAIPVLANDTGNGLTIKSVNTGAAKAMLSIAGGSIVYDPTGRFDALAPGAFVTETFTYTVAAGSGSTATGTVTVTVAGVDDAPLAVDDAADAEEGTPVTLDVLANDTDVDGGPKRIASVNTFGATGTVAIAADGGSLTYTPGIGVCGATDTFTYTLEGGATAKVTVTIACSGAAPTAVDDSAAVAEDAAATAVDVLANDTDPDGGSKRILSATDPANGTVVVAADGSGLTYAPDANYCNSPPGSALDTFTYTLNGGDTGTVTVTVTCVDDAPSAVADAKTLAEDAAATAVDVLANDTDPDAGPRTIGSVTQGGHGAVVVTGGGTGLTYQPAPNFCGPDSFMYTLNGGSTATVSLTVTCSNDPPVADADAYGGGIRGVRMRVGSTHADTHETEHSGSVLDGDTDVDTPLANLTVTPGTITTADGGTVVMASDGSFTYDPPAADDGTDSFTYTVEDNDTGDPDGTERTHSATVTLTRNGPRVWFVDDGAPAGGRGVSHAPLQSLAPLSTGGAQDTHDGSGDHIFVYSGTYPAGIDLEAGQKLLGQPNGLNVNSQQLVAAGGTKPAISSATGHALALHSASNEVQDLALGNTPAGFYSLFAPTGAGAFTVADTDIVNGTGGSLHVADGTPTVTLGTLSSTGSDNNGVRIADTEGGSVSSSGGMLSNAKGADFAASNSNTTVLLGSAISDDLGQLVSVSGGSGDVTYNGTITDGEDGDGDGIAIANTSGDHSFTKSVLLSTGNSNALSMTNSPSGSLRMVPTAGVNRSTTTGGAALTVTDTPIASGGLSFERISAVDPSIEASTYGIHLSNTGSAAGLTVAGVGGTCTQADNSGCTGGTIQGKSTAIKLNNTAGSSFTRMKLTNTGDFGIKGDTVTGFVLNTSVVDGSGGRHGNDANANEGAISFDELFGTGVAITNSVIKEGVSNDLRVRNDSGTLNRLTITGTTFGSTATTHNDAVQLENNGSGALNATIQNSTFTSARGDHIQASIQGTGAGDLVVTGNALSNSHPTSLGGQIVLGASASGDMTYAVNNNTITGAIGTAIVTTATFASGMSNSTAIGTISGNTIGTSGVAGSGSSAASGIDVSVIGNGRNSVQILNNTIRQMSQHGIIAFAGGASRTTTGVDNTGDLNLTVSGNLVEQPHNTASSSSGFQLNAGTNSDGGPDQYDICLGFSNNNMAAAGEDLSSNSRDYVLLQAFETFVRMPGWTGPVTSQDANFPSALQAYLDAKDNGAAALTTFGRTNPTDFNAGIADGFYNTAGSANCPVA